MSIDLNKEGIRLKELEEDLKTWQEYFRSGKFLEEILQENLNTETIISVKVHFQTILEVLDKKQDMLSAEIEDVKSRIREDLKFDPLSHRKNEYWSISLRRNYKYDTDRLHEKALELGINPEEFYKVTKKFDPKRVPDDLKEELKDARSIASITPSVSYKEKT